MLDLRKRFLAEHNNPLGLLYGVHCDTDTVVSPALAHRLIAFLRERGSAMSLRRIPGKSQQYFLITYDKRGDEVPDADGTSASKEAIGALKDPAAGVTDVFILSHGWQGDYDDAIRQYDRWIGAANPDTSGDGIRPFIIGLHWPSKAWSDRELKSAPTGLLGDEPADARSRHGG